MTPLVEQAIDDLLIQNNPYWIELFPNFHIFRFLGIDEFNIKNTESDNSLNHKPIIFINGYNSSHLTWNYLAQGLWYSGFRNIFAVDLFDFTKSLSEILDFFDAFIDIILELTDEFTLVSIISHSIGGVLARHYVKYNERNNIRKVSLLITIASPYYETLTFLRNFGFVFNLIFPTEMLQLFAQEDGLYSLANSNQLLEYNKVTMVNIHGTVKSLLGGDGLFRPQAPCCLINVKIPQNHFRLLKCPEIYYLLKEFLFNEVIIYKISLIELNFPLLKKSGYSYAHFIIKNGKIDQRFPTPEILKISSKKINKFKPHIIFTGKSSAEKKEEKISITLYKNKLFGDEKIIDESFTFRLAHDEPKSNYKKFENKFVSFSIQICSYKMNC